MKDKEHQQVIIIGGGPAGITAGLTLQSRGISCLIIDSHTTNLVKLGECIPPNALPLFKKIGLEKLLYHEEHQFYFGNQSLWGSNEISEKNFLFDKHNKGILLNRSFFETQIKEIAIHNKVKWLNGYSLHTIEKTTEKTKVVVKSKDNTLSFTCDYLIDATGRKASICRKMNVTKETIDQLASISFQFLVEEKIPSFVHTESYQNGWIYLAPAKAKMITVMIFTDIDLLPNKENEKGFVKKIINQSQLIRELLGGEIQEDQILELKTRIANTTFLRKPYGDNWIAVGDAAYSYDPISSYGITSAIAGGYYGAHALTEAISGKTEAFQVYQYIMENAFNAYTIKLKEQYKQEKRWAKEPFWTRRN